MKSPSLELQGAIVTRLKAYTALTALVGQKIFDKIPTNPPPEFPYISLGPEQIVSNDADCIKGFEIFIQVDVWSRAVGFPEAKQIAEEVRAALHDADLSLSENALVLIEHRQSRMLRDADGLTSHAAVEFSAFVEQP